MLKPLTCSMLAAALLAWQPAPAATADTYLVHDTPLFAGPSPDLPQVATLPAGADVSVQGCLDDFTWCDVAAQRGRGWVYADNIARRPDGASVGVRRTGIDVIGFDLLAYWAQNYTDQPWYEERERWARAPRVNRQRWPQFPGQPPINPQPPPPPPPPKQPTQPLMPQPRP